MVPLLLFQDPRTNKRATQSNTFMLPLVSMVFHQFTTETISNASEIDYRTKPFETALSTHNVLYNSFSTLPLALHDHHDRSRRIHFTYLKDIIQLNMW